MEEIQQCEMIRMKLKNTFDENQWKIIKSTPSASFVQQQERLLDSMLQQKPLYDKYFAKFYANHNTLLNWYILASRHKGQIQEYVFKPLVDRKIKFYNEKLKNVLNQHKHEEKAIPKDNVLRQDVDQMKRSLLNNFFNDQLEKNQLTHHKHLSQNIDSHDLYLRTFNACNGWRYIFYDYERHMNGAKHRNKYNNEIRAKSKNGKYECKEPKTHDLMKYEQFAPKHDKVALMSFNMVLANDKINNEKGFQSLLKQNECQKLVFINHQRKPVNYYLRIKDRKSAFKQKTIR